MMTSFNTDKYSDIKEKYSKEKYGRVSTIPLA
jgi:hypothetical protein